MDLEWACIDKSQVSSIATCVGSLWFPGARVTCSAGGHTSSLTLSVLKAGIRHSEQGLQAGLWERLYRETHAPTQGQPDSRSEKNRLQFSMGWWQGMNTDLRRVCGHFYNSPRLLFPTPPQPPTTHSFQPLTKSIMEDSSSLTSPLGSHHYHCLSSDPYCLELELNQSPKLLSVTSPLTPICSPYRSWGDLSEMKVGLS